MIKTQSSFPFHIVAFLQSPTVMLHRQRKKKGGTDLDVCCRYDGRHEIDAAALSYAHHSLGNECPENSEIVLYCKVISSAFLYTVFGEAEKITKHPISD